MPAGRPSVWTRLRDPWQEPGDLWAAPEPLPRVRDALSRPGASRTDASACQVPIAIPDDREPRTGTLAAFARQLEAGQGGVYGLGGTLPWGVTGGVYGVGTGEAAGGYYRGGSGLRTAGASDAVLPPASVQYGHRHVVRMWAIQPSFVAPPSSVPPSTYEFRLVPMSVSTPEGRISWHTWEPVDLTFETFRYEHLRELLGHVRHAIAQMQVLDLSGAPLTLFEALIEIEREAMTWLRA